MKEIPLTKNQVALVDDEDLPLISEYKWHTHKSNGGLYASTNPGRAGQRRFVLMHRLIMGAPKGLQVHHADHNGLNNQKSNLSLATNAENVRHQKLSSKSTSGFKGVSWHKGMKKWRARIHISRQEIVFGYFDTAEEAAKRYDAEVVKHFGEFALTNASLCLYKPQQTP